MNFLRFLMLLSLAVWLGALIFFPVVAQTSFSVLPSTHLAGLVVRNSLLALHWMGITSGVVFVICSLLYNWMAAGRLKASAVSHWLVALMLALTAVSQFDIIPHMEKLRIAAGEINSLAPGDPIRTQFDLLHAWSTRIEEAVLLLGITVLYLTSRRLATSRS
jgi:Domain of unknown function (DUF4149)